MLVADVTWRATESGSYQSGLTVWPQTDSSPRFVPLNRGKELSWVFRGPRLCIGWVDQTGRMNKCPEESIILRAGTRCGPCAAMDITDPCIRCDGRICRAQEGRRAQCEASDYVVYLAVFNDKTLKIGVSTKKRVRTRWIEQGADYGGVLQGVQGGRKARLVEHRLGRRKGLTKQVYASRKIQSLALKMGLAEAQSLADAFLQALDDPFIGLDTKLEDLSPYYHLEDFGRPPQAWRKRYEPVDQKPLAGRIVGMKGSLLITAIGSSYTAADLRQVVGYSIDQDSDITIVTQTGLSDFF